VIGLALFWLLGLVWVVFPKTVLRFYLWFHGPALDGRNLQPKHVRNAGFFWLLVMAAVTFWR
jgi:hypothetical protein